METDQERTIGSGHAETGRIHSSLLIALTLGCVAGAGCLTGSPKHRPDEPTITEIDMSMFALDPTKPLSAASAFVLLNIGVKNPCQAHVEGVIACLADYQQSEGTLEHRFGVAPRKQSSFTVPLDKQKPYAYSVRCQLRFEEDRQGIARSPSPWVKVAIPAREEPVSGNTPIARRSNTQADGNQTRERF